MSVTSKTSESAASYVTSNFTFMSELLMWFNLMGSTKLAVTVLRHSHPDLDLVSVLHDLYFGVFLIVDLLFIRRWIPGSSQTEDEAFILKLGLSDFSIWNTVTSDLLLETFLHLF